MSNIDPPQLLDHSNYLQLANTAITPVFPKLEMYDDVERYTNRKWSW